MLETLAHVHPATMTPPCRPCLLLVTPAEPGVGESLGRDTASARVTYFTHTIILQAKTLPCSRKNGVIQKNFIFVRAAAIDHAFTGVASAHR